MSKPLSHQPRHALAGQASPGVPDRTGPSDAADGATDPEVPAHAGIRPVAGVPEPSRPGDDVLAELGPEARTEPRPQVPAPAPGERAGSGGYAPWVTGVEELPTGAIAVVPAQRAGAPSRTASGYPSADLSARAHPPFAASEPEGRRPATAPGAGSLRLPELPDRVRPVLPIVLGVLTAVVMALGVVGGVSVTDGPESPSVPPATAP